MHTKYRNPPALLSATALSTMQICLARATIRTNRHKTTADGPPRPPNRRRAFQRRGLGRRGSRSHRRGTEASGQETGSSTALGGRAGQAGREGAAEIAVEFRGYAQDGFGGLMEIAWQVLGLVIAKGFSLALDKARVGVCSGTGRNGQGRGRGRERGWGT